MTESRPEATKCRKCGGTDFKIYGDGSGYCLTCNDTFVDFTKYGQHMAYAPQQIAGEHTIEQDRQSPPEQKFPSKKVVAIAIVILLISLSLAYFAIQQPDTLPVSIQEISDLRGLEVLSEPPCRYMSEEELAGMLNESAADWDMLNETRILYSLFLLGPDEDLSEIYKSIMTADISGYYNPEEDEMVIIERQEVPEAMEKLTLAHEYTHALQDQHFDIGTNFTDGYGWDQSLARMSLVEGDATLLELEFFQRMPSDEQYAVFDYALSPEPSETNYAVEQMQAFPYINGYAFADTLHYVSGWGKVNEAYSDPPSTTEHIMHPEKYLAGEMALDVQLSVQMPGMTLCVNETLGEFMVFTMLGFHLPEESVASAAEGWGGDRFHYYQGGEDFLCVWKIAWDTEADCQEFAVAFNTMVTDMTPEERDVFTNGYSGLVTDGSSATFFRASDPALISAVLPQCIG